MFWDCIGLGLVIAAWCLLRDRERRNWIEKNLFAGWKDN